MKMTCPSCGARLEVTVDPSEAGIRPIECISCHALLQWSIRPTLEPVAKEEISESSVPEDEEVLLEGPPPVPELSSSSTVEVQVVTGVVEDMGEEALSDVVPSHQENGEAVVSASEMEPVLVVDEEMILPVPGGSSSVSSGSFISTALKVCVGFALGYLVATFTGDQGSSSFDSTIIEQPVQPVEVAPVTAVALADARIGESETSEKTVDEADDGGVAEVVDMNSSDISGATDTGVHASIDDQPDTTGPAITAGESLQDEMVEDAQPETPKNSKPVPPSSVHGKTKESRAGKKSAARKPGKIKVVESSYDSLMRSGNALLKEGGSENLREAVRAFGLASKRSSSVEPLSKLGACHSRLGDHKAAIQAFKQAIEKNPDFRVAQLGLAKAYRRAGKVEKARRAFESYLVRFPDGNHRKEAQRALDSLR